MKTIIGFEDVMILSCKDCNCFFSIDTDDDIETWIINNQKKSYCECPNCKSIHTELHLLKAED